jgi:metallopeptidase MepB
MNHAQASVRRPPQPPLNFALLADPTSVLQASNKLCENLQQFINNLVSTVTPAKATFDNVVLQLLQHENEMQLTYVITMLSLVAPDTALRNAAAEASDRISHCVMDCKESNVELFRLIDAVNQRQKDDETLDAESRKALVEERRSYIRKGLGLSDAPLAEDANGSSTASSDRDAFKHNTRRLQTIQSEFLKNLDEKPHFIWLTRAELAGVPEDALSGLEAGTGELESKLKLDLNGMQARWMLTVVSSPVTRQKIYLESRRIVS